MATVPLVQQGEGPVRVTARLVRWRQWVQGRQLVPEAAEAGTTMDVTTRSAAAPGGGSGTTNTMTMTMTSRCPWADG